MPFLQPWSDCRNDAIRDLRRAAAGGAPFMPRAAATAAMMLPAYLLEKVLYERGYELRFREWLTIPLARLPAEDAQ